MHKIGKGIVYLVLALWTLLVIYPLAYMLLSSFKSDAENMANPWSLPTGIDFANYSAAWNGVGQNLTLGTYFANSLIVTGGTLLLLTLASLLAGYALGRFKFPGHKLFYKFNFALIAVPVHALLVPVYEYMTRLSLVNNHLGLVLIYAAFQLPFSIIIMRSYFEAIPKAIEEAARLDGCSEWGVFRHVGLPAARGPIATVIIVNVVSIWSEPMFASVLLTNPEKRTLPLGIVQFSGTQFGATVGLLLATLVMSAIPLLLLYFVFQKQIVKGAMLGAVK